MGWACTIVSLSHSHWRVASQAICSASYRLHGYQSYAKPNTWPFVILISQLTPSSCKACACCLFGFVLFCLVGGILIDNICLSFLFCHCTIWLLFPRFYQVQPFRAIAFLHKLRDSSKKVISFGGGAEITVEAATDQRYVRTVVITSNTPYSRVCTCAHVCTHACKQLLFQIGCYSHCFPFVWNRSRCQFCDWFRLPMAKTVGSLSHWHWG